MRAVIEKTWGWDDAWQQADFSKRLSQCIVSIIEVDGRPAGSLWVESTADSIHIVELQIVPLLQGNGIGTAIIRTVIKQGADSGRAVTLSVVPANARAQRLYERLGFEVTAVEDPFIHMRRVARCGAPRRELE